jgi:hypothetical protein
LKPPPRAPPLPPQAALPHSCLSPHETSLRIRLGVGSGRPMPQAALPQPLSNPLLCRGYRCPSRRPSPLYISPRHPPHPHPFISPPASHRSSSFPTSPCNSYLPFVAKSCNRARWQPYASIQPSSVDALASTHPIFTCAPACGLPLDRAPGQLACPARLASSVRHGSRPRLRCMLAGRLWNSRVLLNDRRSSHTTVGEVARAN